MGSFLYETIRRVRFTEQEYKNCESDVSVSELNFYCQPPFSYVAKNTHKKQQQQKTHRSLISEHIKMLLRDASGDVE